MARRKRVGGMPPVGWMMAAPDVHGSDRRAMEAVARGLLDWQQHGATHTGGQTSSVLHAARRGRGQLAKRMIATALEVASSVHAGAGVAPEPQR